MARLPPTWSTGDPQEGQEVLGLGPSEGGISLLWNMLSRLVITFFPRSKRLLISWLQSPSAVILEPRRIKSATVSPSIAMK